MIEKDTNQYCFLNIHKIEILFENAIQNQRLKKYLRA